MQQQASSTCINNKKEKEQESRGKFWNTGLASGSDFCREVSPTVLLLLADRLTELQEVNVAKKNKGRRRNGRGSGVRVEVLGLMLVSKSPPEAALYYCNLQA